MGMVLAIQDYVIPRPVPVPARVPVLVSVPVVSGVRVLQSEED